MTLFRLFLLFTIIPIIELFLLIQLAHITNTGTTIAIILSTGLLGSLAAKTQGLHVWREIEADLAMGRMPAHGLVDGLLILVGGALLITPGLLTDLAGLCCILPWSRARIKRWIRNKLETMLTNGTVVIHWGRR